MKYFKNKKILVTGGAGFIGSNLVKKLVKIGAKISVIVKYNSVIDCPRLLGEWDKINIIEVDSKHFTEEYFAERPNCERLINKRLNDKNLNIMRDWKVSLKEYLKVYYNNDKKTINIKII